MQKFTLLLDLKDTPEAIQSYIDHHKQVWPEVVDSLRAVGVTDLEIYIVENRLAMHVVTTDDFTWEKKAIADQANETVMKWEAMMGELQQPLPSARPGEKWIVAEKIYDMNKPG